LDTLQAVADLDSGVISTRFFYQEKWFSLIINIADRVYRPLSASKKPEKNPRPDRFQRVYKTL
jgi:hypothetical protein